MHFVCVGTPQKRGENAADLRLRRRRRSTTLLPLLKPGDVVVGKSTVPVGTAERLAERIAEREPGADAGLEPGVPARGPRRRGHAAPGPARLRRAATARPARRAARVLDEVYAAALADGTPLIVTDLATAQLVKVAANSFLATKISFINAMAELCEATGADVTQLADAIGHDERIGRQFLNAGLGFGGGCLPKDIRAFMARAGELGVDQALTFLREVDAINMRRRVRMVDLAREVCGGSIVGRRIAVLGRGVQAGQRRHPRLARAQRGRADAAAGRRTSSSPTRRRSTTPARSGPTCAFADTVEDAVRGAELVLLLTEWPEYVDLDPAALQGARRGPADHRRPQRLDPARWRAAGWTYRALGRR